MKRFVKSILALSLTLALVGGPVTAFGAETTGNCSNQLSQKLQQTCNTQLSQQLQQTCDSLKGSSTRSDIKNLLDKLCGGDKVVQQQNNSNDKQNGSTNNNSNDKQNGCTNSNSNDKQNGSTQNNSKPDKDKDKENNNNSNNGNANQNSNGNNSGSGEENNSGSETEESLGTYESQVIDLVNAERAANGLTALKANTKLSAVAELKAKDMRDNSYFSHTSPTYGSPFEMMTSMGISYRSAGENIAKGQKTPKAVMNAWMNSSGHKANILNSGYTEIGVGYVTDNSGGTYWVQMFITP